MEPTWFNKTNLYLDMGNFNAFPNEILLRIALEIISKSDSPSISSLQISCKGWNRICQSAKEIILKKTINDIINYYKKEDVKEETNPYFFGKLKYLDKLIKANKLPQSYFEHIKNISLKKACKEGCSEVVKELSKSEEIKLEENDYSKLREAFNKGHVELGKFLLEKLLIKGLKQKEINSILQRDRYFRSYTIEWKNNKGQMLIKKLVIDVNRIKSQNSDITPFLDWAKENDYRIEDSKDKSQIIITQKKVTEKKALNSISGFFKKKKF
jgi:hypothetical protein